MSGLYDMADYLIYRGCPVGAVRGPPLHTPPHMMDIRFMHDRLFTPHRRDAILVIAQVEPAGMGGGFNSTLPPIIL